MRVLMLAPQPFLEPRGTPISVYQRARGLAQLGHTIDLLTYHVGQDVDIPGMTLHRIPRVPLLRSVRVGPSWYKPLLDLLLFGKALELLSRQSYDVIHTHEEAAFFGGFLARLFGTRHLYDMHSSLPRQLANFGVGNRRPLVSLFEVLERRVIVTADAMITIGADLAQYARWINPQVPQVMIENLPVQDVDAPVDRALVDRLRDELALQDRVAVVYTGTFERYQGIDLLLESLPLVLREQPTVCLIMVGGKPMQVAHARAIAERLGIAEAVRFVGTVPLDQVSAYVELADILVSPRIEGTSAPLKIYSYLAAGKPIVATDLLAHTLVLSHETALLVAPTAADLAAGLLRLIGDRALLERLATCARQDAAARYSPAQYQAKLAQIYAALESSAPRPGHPAARSSQPTS